MNMRSFLSRPCPPSISRLAAVLLATLTYVEPRTAGRREVDMEAWMAGFKYAVGCRAMGEFPRTGEVGTVP